MFVKCGFTYTSAVEAWHRRFTPLPKDALHSLVINGTGAIRGQLANPGSPGNMAVKMAPVCMVWYGILEFNVPLDTV